MTENNNYEVFLSLDKDQYRGQWVAIAKGNVVVATGAFKKTFEEAKAKFPREKPLIAKIPSKRIMIL